MTVDFENDSKMVSRKFSRCSPDIARYNTMSIGDDWRLCLEPGDLIDAFDTTKVWYSSTIVEK